ncbi:cytochrome c [Aestuariicoccus sp. MJ-SS9]|uniref:c-type cytochrome n=1 Tax=Aestuariicoccus sp. MJ-SS9 TaxID=3079855 RepID=UPI0029126BBC|nr:cytochrome c [Aestuariicoccus sp. MJ-SS9]MDU8912819.1 cytochrome c [Aestuariicoccus sp. MJ-SS9]
MTRARGLVTCRLTQIKAARPGFARPSARVADEGGAMRHLAILLAAAVAACAPVPETDLGARFFAENCALCHGRAGQGDGTLAEDLPVAVPDLTTLAARNGGDFPEAAVMAQIHGYPGRHHSSVMPEFGPRMAGRVAEWTAPSGKVIATPVALLELVDYLKTIQR